MPASITDKLFRIVGNSGWQVGSGGVADAVVTTIPISSPTGLPTDTAVLATIDRVDGSGSKTPTKMERVIGVISGSNLVNCIRGVEGTAQPHIGGAVIEVVISAKNINSLIDHILTEHNQDGTHNAFAALSIIAAKKASGAEVGVGTDDTKIVTPKAIGDSYIASQFYGMARQAIMNGNFDVWQRGTSVALTDVTKTFLADRWNDYIDKNGGTLPTLTRSRQVLTSGDIPGAFAFVRLNTNGAGTSLGVSSYHRFSQFIENGVRNLCGLGKKVTVSFYAKSDIANKRICPTLRMNYGSGGSPSSEEIIKGTPITLTSSWVKYTATFTTNTLIGKTFGTNLDDYLELDFYTMWGTTWGNTYIQTSVTAETYVGSGNIDIAQIQLCSGDVALPFQPKSYEEELRMCFRYYEIFGAGAIARAMNATTAQGFGCQYKVRKRASAPTINLLTTSPIVGEIGVSNRSGSGSTRTVNSSNDPDGSGDITLYGFSGMTAGNMVIMLQDYFECISEL